MKEVALIMCPYAYPYSIPYQLGYLKKILCQNRIDSKVYDFSIECHKQFKNIELDNLINWQDENCFEEITLPLLDNFIEKMLEQILATKTDILGFSVFNTNRLFCIEVARRIKKRKNSVQIVFGGVDCTISFNSGAYSSYGNLLRENIVDAVIMGEGEHAFLNYCLGKESLGVVTKKELKKKKFRMYPFVEDLNQVPFPDYSDLNLSHYDGDVMPLSFSRGCNFNCTFCEIETLWCKQLRTRSAESVFDEIKYLESITDKKVIFFNGAYVNCLDDFIETLSDKIIAEWGANPRFIWNGWAKIHRNLSPKVLRKMKRSGCYELVFGLESGSQKVINDMKKGFRVTDAQQIIRDVALAGIDVTVFIIVGYPTETEDDFQMTLDFLTRNKDYIRAAYCMSECILSDKMIRSPAKYGIRKDKKMDAFRWISADGLSYEDRQLRLKRFYRHLEEIGLNHS